MNVHDVLSGLSRALTMVPSWAGIPGWVVLVVAVSAVIIGTKVVRAARRSPGGLSRGADNLGTLVVAGLATAVSANGMWRFFGDVLNIHGPGQVILFAYLEIILAVSALRARRIIQERIDRIRQDRRDDGEGLNVHQVLVWTVAGLSGGLSALDAPGFAAKVMRIAAPLLAATLWEVGQWSDLVSARRQAGLGRPRSSIAWRLSPQRIFVWLRLADPTARDAGEVDQTRRITALAKAAWRAHSSPEGTRRRRIAEWRLRRLAFAAINHADLGANPEVTWGVQVRLAASYQLLDGTSKDAVEHIQPWRAAAATVHEMSATPTTAGLTIPVAPPRPAHPVVVPAQVPAVPVVAQSVQRVDVGSAAGREEETTTTTTTTTTAAAVPVVPVVPVVEMGEQLGAESVMTEVVPAQVPAVPVVAQSVQRVDVGSAAGREEETTAAVIDLRDQEGNSRSTGDRTADAVAIYERYKRDITGPQMQRELEKLGWVLAERTALRVVQQCADAARERRPGVVALAHRR